MNDIKNSHRSIPPKLKTNSDFLRWGMVYKLLPILIIITTTIPTFYKMFPSGIFTMHDFHVFRQFEFQKCVSDHIFPCRWAPDAGLGYGEPIFNFYGQLPYWLGAIPAVFGAQVIDSVKFSFAFSLLASALAMYLLARNFWKPSGAVLASVFYIYAPYRAVDVWVRGALPEALGFVFFPLLLHFLYFFLKNKTYWSLLGFTFSLAGLISTHNLSAFISAPFLLIWGLYFSFKFKSMIQLLPLFLAGLFSAGLSAFYLAPVIFENSLTTLGNTTVNYYDFHIHYTTLSQLFISDYWGYGGTTWGPNDTMSFSVGFWHWLLPLVLLTYAVFRKIFFKKTFPLELLLFFSLGLFAIFLTHGKSDPLWNIIPGMPFIQFPWRFLTMSTLFLSLTAGWVGSLFSRKLGWLFSGIIIVGLIITNISHYRPDIWHTLSDRQYFSGKLWDEQRSSALQDYWPRSAPEFPKKFAPDTVEFIQGSGSNNSFQKYSSSATYQVSVQSGEAELAFPIVYFPGWTATINGKQLSISPSGQLGLITAQVPQGDHTIHLSFIDTPVRKWGNNVSLLFLALSVIISVFNLKKHVQK